MITKYTISFLDVISISSTRIFLVDYNYLRLHLVSMDWENCTLNMLHSQQRLHQRLIRIVFDSKNSNRFLLIANTAGSTNVYFGFVDSEKSFLIDDIPSFKLNKRETCLNFIGNNCFALNIGENQRIEYVSFNLSAEKVEADLQFTFEIDEDVDLSKMKARFPQAITRYPYAWCEYVCFVVLEEQILVFNIQIGKCFPLIMRPTGPIRELFISSDGILTMQSKDSTIYRVTLKSPDKLETICRLNMRRRSLFFGQDVYEKILNDLSNI